MARKINAKQLENEIKAIANLNFLDQFCRGHHMFERHCNKDLSFLKSRMRVAHRAPKTFVMSTFNSELTEKQVALKVAQAAYFNMDEIKSRLETNPDCQQEFICYSKTSLGFGIIRGADWDDPIYMSGIKVILAPGDRTYIKLVSAYPFPTTKEMYNALQKKSLYK